MKLRTPIQLFALASFAAFSLACAAETDAESTTSSAGLAQSLETNEDGSDEVFGDVLDATPVFDPVCEPPRLGQLDELGAPPRHWGDGSGPNGMAPPRDGMAPPEGMEPPREGMEPPRDGMSPPEEMEPARDGEFADGEGFRPGPARQSRAQERARLVHAAYDQDHDGKLDEAERGALQSDLAIGCNARLERLTADFDVDEDGELSEEELAGAKLAFQERFEEHRAQVTADFDVDGDGTLSEEEHRAAHEARQQRMQERQAQFDVDGDGALSEEEREQLFAEVQARVRGELPAE